MQVSYFYVPGNHDKLDALNTGGTDEEVNLQASVYFPIFRAAFSSILEEHFHDVKMTSVKCKYLL